MWKRSHTVDTPYVSTAKSVKGHETRPDGRAIAMDTGYQSNFRYGAQQSFTRDWLMPMHQLDSLPGKHAVAWKFKFGYQVDNHAVNTVPKECLMRITKAEDGGIGGRGPWEPVRTGFTPGQENEFMINVEHKGELPLWMAFLIRIQHLPS